MEKENTELVLLKKGEALTTSNLVSEEFSIAHRELVRKIKNLTVEISTVVCNKMYRKSTYTNKHGRKYENYLMNRDGYMFLVMNISTSGANKKKLRFIEAFNAMEKRLLNQQNVEWNKTRELGKQTRIEMTDKVKDFIEYAKEQGSGAGVKFYYANLTKATNKALELLQNEKPKTRDVLDKMELFHLVVAENALQNLMEQEMKKGTHYKEIYVLCKIKLEEIAKTLLFVEAPKTIT